MVFSFSGAASNPAPAPPPSANQAQAQQNAAAATLTIPSFDELFPNKSICQKIGHLIRCSTSSNEHDAKIAGQELKALLNEQGVVRHRLLQIDQDPTLQPVQPDLALRQRLSQNPTVLLPVQLHDGTVEHREATLTPVMLRDVCNIADDLQISETAAICLYHQAASGAKPFYSSFVKKCLKGTTILREESAAWSAREIFFAQRRLLLRTCQSLVQHRLVEKGTDNNLICRATDVLLQNNWIKNIEKLARAYSQRINDIIASYNNTADSGVTNTATEFWRGIVTLQCYYDERQIAVECLFFIAYHVQLTAEEVGILIDLVRDLSETSVVLDPLIDVPDPFATDSSSAAPASFFLQPPRREKNPLAWQQELVKSCWQTGQPQLLRCYCTVIMAVVAALGSHALLMDRSTHAPNSFRMGNALLPPGSTSVENLTAIHQRLSNDSANGNWKRTDVLGILMAAYAMLLRSSPSAVSSPRAPGNVASPRGSGIDLRRALRECLESPAKNKSFTFARICLIPSLKKSKSPASDELFDTAGLPCDVTEFLLSVLAEFGSQFLDALSSSGECPVSRARWEQEMEEALQVRRDQHQKQQDFHGQFGGLSGPDTLGGAVPLAVDLLQRPDCMDDIIAFATAVCSLGPNYVLPFWSQGVHDTSGTNEDAASQELLTLAPSRALRILKRQMKKDESLEASYISFLAALALAENPSGGEGGAAVIHSILSIDSNDPRETNWTSVVETLRLYVLALDPLAKTTKKSAKANLGKSSTAYYYYYDQGVPSESTSNGHQNVDASSSPRPLELSQTNSFHLMSLLAIVANVASRSPSARKVIATMNIPIFNPDRSVVGQDSAMMILFRLSLLPLHPDHRGAVFGTLATLLSMDGATEEESAEIRKVAAGAWELLDQCQIIPIRLLEQYPSPQEAGGQISASLLFPLSSTTAAADPSRRSWIAADQRYVILYEMEFVESALGYYPSTENFLRLLASLFTVGGAPDDLGKGWRSRPGCAPYFEYVLTLVLPRALGSFPNLPALPFRTVNDKSRLLALAMAVVEAVLYRYLLPLPSGTGPTAQAESSEKLAERSYKMHEAAAKDMIGHDELVKYILLPPHPDNVKFARDDFRSRPAEEAHSTIDSALPNEHLATSLSSTRTASHAPRPKSPGFMALASMLSVSGQLLLTVSAVLAEESSLVLAEESSDLRTLAMALYGNTPPVFTKAKETATLATISSSKLQSMLEFLWPTFRTDTEPHWGSQTVLSALRIICASFAREELFWQCLHKASSTSLSIVPVLNFDTSKLVPKVVEVRPSKLSSLLLLSNTQSSILRAVVRLMGFVSSDERTDANIATAAITTMLCTKRTLPQDRVREILGHTADQGRAAFIRAFNKRFQIVPRRPFDLLGIRMANYALNSLLRELREDRQPGESLAALLFATRLVSPATDCDCLGSLLELSEFASKSILDPDCAPLAASCYESIFYLTKLSPELVLDSLCIAERLQAVDFWKMHLMIISSAITSMPDRSTIHSSFIHATAWLLKGVGGELHRLAGFTKETTSGFELVVAPNLGLYKNLCHILFSSDGNFIEQVLLILPIEKLQFESPSMELNQQSISEAREEFLILEGYATINPDALIAAEKARNADVDDESLRSFVEQWNYQVIRDCASAHLSDAIDTVVGASACTSHCFDLSSHFVAGGKLLERILSRMAAGIDAIRSPGLLDDSCYTTACRNLCSAALSCCQQAKTIGEASDTGFIVMACSLLVQMIAYSGGGVRLGPDSLRRDERVAYLASGLLLLLKDLPSQVVSDHFNRDRESSDYYLSAVVLANLCCSKVVEAGPAVTHAQSSPVAYIFRTCLVALLEVLEAAQTERSLCREILGHVSNGSSQSPVQSMIELLPLHESQVAFLLQNLTHFPGVASLLLQRGVLNALEAAADNYYVEEANSFPPEARNMLYGQNLTIGTPSFLLGHLELIGALMAAYSSSGQRERREIALGAIAIIRKYDSVFERLREKFPFDGDVLKAMVRCLAQVDSMLSDHDLVTVTARENALVDDVIGGSLRGRVVMISMHVAEHPLPDRFLGQLPPGLRELFHGHSDRNGVVVVSAPRKKTWWDVLDSGSQQCSDVFAQNIDNYVLEHALRGAALVCYGLRLHRGLDFLLKLDDLALSRALFRCSSAVMCLQARLMNLTYAPQSAAGMDSSYMEILVVLRSKLTEVVAHLLCLLLVQVDAMKSGRIASSVGEETFCQSVSDILDQMNLEKPGEYDSDENIPSYIANLAGALRKATQL